MSSTSTYHLGRFVEGWTPLLSALASFTALLFFTPYNLNEICGKLVNAYFTIFSIALGFELSSLCLVSSFSQNDFFKAMKQMGVFKLYIRYHFRAFRWTLLAIAVSILELLFEPQHYPIADFLFVSIGIGALLAAKRVFMMFKITLRNSGIL